MRSNWLTPSTSPMGSYSFSFKICQLSTQYAHTNANSGDNAYIH